MWNSTFSEHLKMEVSLFPHASSRIWSYLQQMQGLHAQCSPSRSHVDMHLD
jgi:hypothetical protein